MSISISALHRRLVKNARQLWKNLKIACSKERWSCYKVAKREGWSGINTIYRFHRGLCSHWWGWV
jgi:hypothetical protein